MIGLAVWLTLVAVLDLVRGGRDVGGRLLVVLAGGGALLALLAAFAVRPTGGGWLAWVVAVLAVAAWILGSGVAGARFRGRPLANLPPVITAVPAAAVAYAGLGAGTVALLIAGPAAGTAPNLITALSSSGLASRRGTWLLLLLALFLIQISTANLFVRLLLDLVGVPASDNEKKLRGGRVLGPMERVVIVGLGVGGSLMGAAVVVAAKSLLRFPELRVPRAGDPGYGGPSDVTEYFLVGSFASWLVALAAVGLIGLTS